MKCNQVTVRWFDGYLEEFNCSEVRFGAYILWMRLVDSRERIIPLTQVRWFSQSIESHQRVPRSKPMPPDDSLDDYFRDVKAIKQQKRENNRLRSAEVLTQRGIAFASKNDGAHLVVSHTGHVVDFWPGTGKFIFRQSGNKGRGVFALLKKLGVE